MRYENLYYAAAVMLAATVLSSCANAETNGEDEVLRIDVSEGEVLGIPLELGYDELPSLQFEFNPQQIVDEGEIYQSAMIIVSPEIEFQATFDENSELYSLETTSNSVADINGVRIGSTLEQVTNSWPSGRFVYGEAHGRFARFITGTETVFSFDPSAMDSSCFESMTTCEDTEDLLVQRIVIYSVPVPIP